MVETQGITTGHSSPSHMNPAQQPKSQQRLAGAMAYHPPMPPQGVPPHAAYPLPMPPQGVPPHAAYPPPMLPHGVPPQVVYPLPTPPHTVSPHEPLHRAYHGVQYPQYQPMPPTPPYLPTVHGYGQHFQGWPMYAPYTPAHLPAPAPATAPLSADTSVAGNTSTRQTAAALEGTRPQKKYLNKQRRPGGKLFGVVTQYVTHLIST